jgi:hypothetical protein
VPDSAPRLSPRLLAALERIDDGRLPIAELRRRVGTEAERLGLARPSYERVRILAHETRARRARATATDVLLDVAMRVRPPEAILDHLAGTDQAK